MYVHKEAYLFKHFTTAVAPNDGKNKLESTYTSFSQGGQLKYLGYIWSMESKVIIRKAKRKQKQQINTGRPDSKRSLGHIFQ